MSGIARKLMGVTKGADVDPDLVLVFDTSLGDLTVEVPLANTVNVIVDWGDDSSDTYTAATTATHTYVSGGVYTVRISGSLSRFGATSDLNRPELTRCLSFGNLGITVLSGAFRACANLTEVPDTLPIGVTGMARMFRNAASFNQDIGSWDVSNVTAMDGMFGSASSMTFPLGSWQTNLAGQPVNFSNNASATFQSYRGTADFPLLADGTTRIST